MRIAFAILLCALAAAAGATEIAGAAFDDRMLVGGESLVLNGTGLRRIFLVKTYAIGLYLPHRDATVEEALADRGAKRIRIVLMRDLAAEQLIGTLDSGLHRNLSDAEFQPLAGRLESLRQTIRAIGAARQGSAIHLDWLPRGGDGFTQLTVNGQPGGAGIPGEDFFRALLMVWLGPKVRDPDLRERLLGKELP